MAGMQEAGGFVGNQSPSDTMHPVTTCSANTGGSIAGMPFLALLATLLHCPALYPCLTEAAHPT